MAQTRQKRIISPQFNSKFIPQLQRTNTFHVFAHVTTEGKFSSLGKKTYTIIVHKSKSISLLT